MPRRLGLHMIVKNEAHVIERALRSCLPLIDYWVICDTGSTDGTQEVIREVMKGVPGELHETDWVDFGTNRQESLDLLRASELSDPEDYTLWIDADDVFVGSRPNLEALPDSGYMLNVHHSGTTYPRIHLIKVGSGFEWKGVLHEALYAPPEIRTPLYVGLDVEVYRDGARSKDPNTYAKDARILKKYLEKNPNDSRTQFYLAQSYRDAGMPKEAYEMYLARVGNSDGWVKERAYAALMAATLLEKISSEDKMLRGDLLQTSWTLNPVRSEPLIQLAWLEINRNRFHIAHLWATMACSLAEPGQDFFVDPESYTWKPWQVLCMTSILTNKKEMAVAAAESALHHRPEDDQLKENLELAKRM